MTRGMAAASTHPAAFAAGGRGRVARWRHGLAAIGLLALALFAGLAAAQALQPVPALKARVTDLTGTLDAGQRQQLEAQLAAIEQRKGAQVVVLMLSSTQPEPIEDYGIRLAEAWKIGRGQVDGKRVDDGVILIVAKDDRKVRIEVGYGLEGAIPDAIAKRIIAETIAPRFRAGDFFGGLQAAIADLGRLIEGEALPQPWQHAQDGEVAFDPQTVAAGVLIVLVGGMIATAVLGRLLGSLAGGAGAGALAAIVGAPWVLAGIVAVVAFVLFLVFAASGGHGIGPRGRGGSRGGPVIWTGGGWGGGSSGGGFGGGGGGFGGGGASGNW